MRLRLFVGLVLLLAALSLSMALAGTVTYDETLYVFPGERDAQSTLSLAVTGVSLDLDTLLPVEEPLLAGAVFGVYTMDAQGTYAPLADPADPTRPLTIVSDRQAVSVALPTGIDLYLKQEAAPEGYAVDTQAEPYRRLSLPEAVTYTNRKLGMQGLWLSLQGVDAYSESPLAGVVFSLEGMGEAYTLTTDENGAASQSGIAPGTYTLRQQTVLQGYGVDRAELEITIEEHVPLVLQLQNSREGYLSLRALGLSLDADRSARLIPINRTYEVLDSSGQSHGTLTSGDTLALPATREGVDYMLKAAASSTDGYAADEEVHTVTIVSGNTMSYQTAVQSTMGFFAVKHLSAQDHAAVPGGDFVLMDDAGNAVHTFSVGQDGVYSPITPLPSGNYTLHMQRAADRFLYGSESIPVQIQPYLEEAAQVAEVAFYSTPIPESLQNPQVCTNTQHLPSLFDADAEITFSLSAFAEAPTYPVSALTYTYALPQVPGLTVMEETADGARLHIARRFPLEGVSEIEEIRIAGTVSYVFDYPVDAAGNTARIEVAAPFEAIIATFAASSGSGQFAVSGHVYDERGEAVPGIRVSLGDAQTYTDPFGAYAFAENTGNLTPVFDAPEGYGPKVEGMDAHLLPLRTISGKVVKHGDVDGYPVTLFVAGANETHPSGDGSFALTGVFTQEDALQAQTPEGVLFRIEGDGEETTVHLYAAASVVGMAATPENAPLPGVQITLTGPEETRDIQTDENGRYLLEGLYPGDYTLQVAPPEGYVLNTGAGERFALEAGETKEAAHINAMQPGTIEGVLYDGDAPYASVAISLQPDGQEAYTDAGGRFSFDGLRAGRYTLSYALAEDTLVLDAPEAISIQSSGERITCEIRTIRPASMQGMVWYDEDDDGLLGSSETGIPSVRVVLLDREGETVSEIETDQHGGYAFEGLYPGQYRIAITLPADMIFAREAPGAERVVVGVDNPQATSGEYTLSSGQRLEGLMCGATDACALEGTLWEDQNGNGLMDAEEARLSGLDVELLRGETVLRTAQSDEAGRYQFTSLRGGDYIVRVTLPQAYQFTVRAENYSSDMTSAFAESTDPVGMTGVSLRRWHAKEIVNVGALRPASLTGGVWFDMEASGVNPGNSPYPEGIAVTLHRVSSGGKSVVQQIRTDASGLFAFDHLRPGVYQLQYDLPDASQWTFTGGVEQTDGGAGYGATVSVVSGDAATIPDVGITMLGSITGLAFEDMDYNGLRDEGERGLIVDVTLLRADGQAVSQTQTDESGAYSFTRVKAGMYALRLTLPEGFAFTKYRTDAPSFNSDVQGGEGSLGDTDSFYLPMGEMVLMDAGAYRMASVSGAVWVDGQNNGLYSDENAGVAGVTVTLLAEDGAQRVQTLTDEQGEYRFEMLTPGTYAVAFSIQEGMRFSQPADSTGRRSMIPATEEREASIAPFAVGSGDRQQELDAGVVYTGGVSGRAVNMKDQSGVAGVEVTLLRGEQPLGQTVTGEDGGYSFGDIRPGAVAVRFATPDGWTMADETEEKEARIPQGATAEAVDIHYIPEASIRGIVWLDANADGVYDSETEAPLLGASVELYQASGEDRVLLNVVQTDSDGRYVFSKLLAGEYLLHLRMPAGIATYGASESPVFTLEMGAEREDRTPAFIASTIAGTVWEDISNDGLVDTDEPLLAAVEVALVREDDSIIQSTTTDEYGTYRFENVQPVRCAVRYTLPENYMFTGPVQGGSVVPVTDDHIAYTEVFDLSMGETHEAVHAGALQRARIGDLVWLDENGNGLQDTHEPGIADMRVQLWQMMPDGEERMLEETQTDRNGRYRFDALRPGTFYVAFLVGDTYVPTEPVTGMDQISSKLPWKQDMTLRTEAFPLPSGRHLLNIDAGLVTLELADQLGWQIERDGQIHR